MRMLGKHRLSATALALAFAAASATASDALASPAAAPGARSALAPLSALVAPAQPAPSTISIEVAHLVGVQVQTPVHVQAPNVEVPGVAKVETSSPPSAEASAPPSVKVEVTTPTSTPSEAPTLTTPSATVTASTPVVSSPKAAAPSGSSTSAAPAAPATSAAAPNASSGASGDSAGTRGAALGRPSTPTGARGSTRARTSSHAARQPPTARSTRATGAVTGSLAPGAAASGSRTPASSRVAAERSAHSASSSNPLNALGRQLPFPKVVPDWSRPIILLLLLLALALGARSQRAARRARRLERQRAALLGDLDAMQATLVPAIPARLGALAVSVAYRPADGPAAGGDFYDLFVLAPGRVAIVLGDVVGHGRAAIDQAALTRYTLRAYLQAGLEPRAAIALANSVLTQPGEKRFATVVVGVHDAVSGTLTYACAGHPPPIALDCATPEPLTVCCSAPLCCDLPTGRRQTTISLPAGGRVYFFSDGLLEARVGDDLLGRERLAELAAEPSTSASALLARVRAETHATPDDMVACILSPALTGHEPADAGGAIEELEVDRQCVAGSRVARFLEAAGVDRERVAPLLARARAIVDVDGSALLRVERSIAGEASVAIGAGVPAPAWMAPAGDAREKLVALPNER